LNSTIENDEKRDLIDQKDVIPPNITNDIPPNITKSTSPDPKPSRFES
jgi:hypothetical protein